MSSKWCSTHPSAYGCHLPLEGKAYKYDAIVNRLFISVANFNFFIQSIDH